MITYTIPRVYLSSTLYTDKPHDTWRTEFESIFRRRYMDVEFVNPHDIISKDPLIVLKDKKDIDSCKFVVAYIARKTIGTSMEILYAHDFNKLVYVIDPMNQLKEDPWLVYHSHGIFDNIHTCADCLIRSYFRSSVKGE